MAPKKSPRRSDRKMMTTVRLGLAAFLTLAALPACDAHLPNVRVHTPNVAIAGADGSFVLRSGGVQATPFTSDCSKGF
jgi:hypothetical protein